jgi:hypothetical protein
MEPGENHGDFSHSRPHFMRINVTIEVKICFVCYEDQQVRREHVAESSYKTKYLMEDL